MREKMQVDEQHLPLFLDPALDVVHRALSSRLLLDGQRFALRRTLRHLNGIALGPELKRSLGAKDASDAFATAIPVVENELKQWASRYPSMRWLWFLRRVPEHVFSGAVSTTFGYDMALAETIAGMSTNERDDGVVSGGLFSYSVDREMLTWLARFCGGAKWLSHLHVLYRWSAKGASFQFRRGVLPINEAEMDLIAAGRLYDDRVASEGALLRRAGTPVSEDVGRQTSVGDVMLVHRISGSIRVSCPRPGRPVADGDYELCPADMRFSPTFLSLAKLQRLLADPRMAYASVLSSDAVSLVYLLASAGLLVSRHSAGFYSLLTTGYLIWSEMDRPIAWLIEGYSEISDTPLGPMLVAAGIRDGQDVIECLMSLKGQSWPLIQGPALHGSRGWGCIDFVAATHRLDATLHLPQQGGIANARAQHFEDEVQLVIDATRWRPEEPLRSLRRRTLRIQGRKITDIDALGCESQGRLLLVSCKSMPYTPEYDAGYHRAVRNEADRLEKAVEALGRTIALLRRDPVGDNYDFTGFADIVGVVCTPHVVFGAWEVVSRYAAIDLRITSSVRELAHWLEENGEH